MGCIKSATLVVLAPTLALAQHGGDITVIVDGTKMRTGIVEGTPSGGTLIRPQRVFESEFEDFGGVFLSDEPGFDIEDGTLPGLSLLGFDILRALRVWDGAGFAAIPAETITIELGPQSRTTPSGDVIVPGFGMMVDGEGGLHTHFDYILDSSAGVGIYLLELRLWSDAGLSATKPWWIVFNNAEDEPVHEAAVEWARENLVPAPASAPVIATALVGMRRRRRCC